MIDYKKKTLELLQAHYEKAVLSESTRDADLLAGMWDLLSENDQQELRTTYQDHAFLFDALDELSKIMTEMKATS